MFSFTVIYYTNKEISLLNEEFLYFPNVRSVVSSISYTFKALILQAVFVTRRFLNKGWIESSFVRSSL